MSSTDPTALARPLLERDAAPGVGDALLAFDGADVRRLEVPAPLGRLVGCGGTPERWLATTSGIAWCSDGAVRWHPFDVPPNRFRQPLGSLVPAVVQLRGGDAPLFLVNRSPGVGTAGELVLLHGHGASALRTTTVPDVHACTATLVGNVLRVDGLRPRAETADGTSLGTPLCLDVAMPGGPHEPPRIGPDDDFADESGRLRPPVEAWLARLDGDGEAQARLGLPSGVIGHPMIDIFEPPAEPCTTEFLKVLVIRHGAGDARVEALPLRPLSAARGADGAWRMRAVDLERDPGGTVAGLVRVRWTGVSGGRFVEDASVAVEGLDEATLGAEVLGFRTLGPGGHDAVLYTGDADALDPRTGGWAGYRAVPLRRVGAGPWTALAPRRGD